MFKKNVTLSFENCANVNNKISNQWKTNLHN